MSTVISSTVSHGQESHSHLPQTKDPASHSHHSDGTKDHGHNGKAAHHAHDHKPPAKQGMATWTWQWTLLIFGVLLAGGFVVYLVPNNNLTHTTGAELSHLIELASKGVPPAPRKDGIVVRTLSSSGITVVTAEGVIPKLCVSAGWDLVKDGTLTINGVTPARVSAAKLSELCNAQPTATLTWMPEEKQ